MPGREDEFLQRATALQEQSAFREEAPIQTPKLDGKHRQAR